MILIIRLYILFLVLNNFSFSSNKLFILPVLQIFMELKFLRYFFIKVIRGFIVFLFLNYNMYIYYSVGLTINYGYVFIYAIRFVFILWIVWFINNWISMIGHFLPRGIEGVLKIFIPVLEIIGVLIRPITLAIRLATNIRCGHVVSLIFRFFVFNVANYLVISISVLLFGLYFIEFLVCVIQAYVFWSLLYIYIREIEI